MIIFFFLGPVSPEWIRLSSSRGVCLYVTTIIPVMEGWILQ